MNSCGYVADNRLDKFVGEYPQVIRKLYEYCNVHALIRFFSSIHPRFFAGFQSASPHTKSTILQRRVAYFSAFPQPLLLLLLCIYKKGQ